MSRVRVLLLVVACADLGVGAGVLLWPGVWQELLHPEAMGTTFDALQRTGAFWMARGLAAAVAAGRRSAGLAAAVALAWLLEAPADLLHAWRMGDTGPRAAPFFVGRALLCAGVWAGLRRRV